MDRILAEDIIDRQKLRRKLSFWRIAAIAILLLAIVISALQFTGDDAGIGKDHIARISIEGTITEDLELIERIEKVTKSEHVKGAIIAMDSPGGTTVGGEAIYEAVRKLSEAKPTAVQIGTLSASAGYMISVGADHIVARKTSIVGSIGVLFQYPNVEALLQKIGIDMRAIKSSPIKAEPDFFGDTPPEAEAMIRSMIMDSYDWFRDIVAERRGFSPSEISAVADGSIFTGRQALDKGLVDALGGEAEAKDWLVEQGVDSALEVVTWEAPRAVPSSFFLGQLRDVFLGTQALDGTALQRIEERLFLDGLLSVWHGAANH